MTISPLQDPHLRDVPTVDGYKVLEPAVLVEKLPEGGMAAVYRGMHLDLKVEVAVKVLKRSGESHYSPQAVARFRQEAEQAARLNDPNLVRIYDFPANRLGLLYLVMEYVDGETLESRIHRKGRLSSHEAATIALFATKGLHTAHSEGVIHRDIKPPNLLISKKGKLKVTDLGIAKAQDSAAMGMTQEITLLGTPQYMAPELWRGARFASAASDVFAVGATLAFMLVGRHVLDGADTQEIMHRALTEGFPDMQQLSPDLPPAMTEIIRLCTLSDPRKRITVDGLLEKLSAVIWSYGGEFPLADADAGATVQPLSPTRFPSRADLEVIRKKIDEIDAAVSEPKPVPRTLREMDDPHTAAVAMQAFLGTQAAAGPAPRTPPLPPAPRAIAPKPLPAQRSLPPQRLAPPPPHAPAQVYYGSTRKSGKRRQKSGVGGALMVLFFLVLIAGAGVFAVQQGWHVDLQAYLSAGNPAVPPASQPATQPASRPTTLPTFPATQPLTLGHQASDVPATGNTSNTIGLDNPATRPIGVASSQPVSPATRPVQVASSDPARPTTPDVRPPETKPSDTKPPIVKPPDLKPPAVNATVPLTKYEAARKAVLDETRQGQWPSVLSRLTELRRLASLENATADFVATADTALRTFRADQSLLSLRRTNYPTLESQLQPAFAEGSSVAALLMAECWLDYEGAGAARKLRTLDDVNGFAHVIRYLEQVKPQSPLAAEAENYLQEARLRQVDFLADKKAWSAMVEWLPQIPLAELAKSPEASSRAVQRVSDQLRRLWSENKDLAERQRLTRDVAPLAPFAAAGSTPAAILMAEGLMRYQGEGAARKLISLDKEKGFQRIIELCVQARKSASDPAIAQAAGAYLFDAAVASVREAAANGAWTTAIDNLVKGQSLITSEQQPTWKALAEKTLMDFRAGNVDLEKRREAFPDLFNQIEPLSAIKVSAALLVQAERYMKFEGDPPHATPTAGDPKFQLARDLVSKVISAPHSPADVRQAAMDREWDIYAYFARQSLDEKRIDRLLDKLKLVAICAANDTREADYGRLVDELLPPGDPKYAIARTDLAEHRMQVVENDRGLRAVSQTKESVQKGIRAMLIATRDSIDPKARARANALLGELELASKGKSAAAYAYFKDGCRVERAGELADPIALMGLALFWSLNDTDLQAADYKDPIFEELRQVSATQRTLKTLALYAEAARSGDAFANFLAGQYTWRALKPTPENARRAETHLQAAIDRGHKRAAQYLQVVRSGGR